MTPRVYTDEQILIFTELIDPSNPVIAIQATAGSVLKTYLGKLEYNFS